MTPPYRLGTDPSTDSLTPTPSTDSYVRTYPQTDRERDQVERDGFLLSNAREIEPFYSDDRATLYRGEALAVLRDLPTDSVDALITDPPYSSGGMIRGDRIQDVHTKYARDTVQTGMKDLGTFSGDTRDSFGYWFWASVWLAECQRVLKPGAIAALFTDWRQVAATIGGIQSGGYVFRGIVPWHKPNGRPIQGRWANSCEYVVWGTNGPRDLDICGGKAFPGFFQATAPPTAEREHMTQKPVSVMREMVKIVPDGGLVLDLFMGSGSTGVAAVSERRRFIGVELVPEHVATAERRIRIASGQAIDDGAQGAMDFGGAA